MTSIPNFIKKHQPGQHWQLRHMCKHAQRNMRNAAIVASYYRQNDKGTCEFGVACNGTTPTKLYKNQPIHILVIKCIQTDITDDICDVVRTGSWVMASSSSHLMTFSFRDCGITDCTALKKLVCAASDAITSVPDVISFRVIM